MMHLPIRCACMSSLRCRGMPDQPPPSTTSLQHSRAQHLCTTDSISLVPRHARPACAQASWRSSTHSRSTSACWRRRSRSTRACHRRRLAQCYAATSAAAVVAAARRAVQCHYAGSHPAGRTILVFPAGSRRPEQLCTAIARGQGGGVVVVSVSGRFLGVCERPLPFLQRRAGHRRRAAGPDGVGRRRERRGVRVSKTRRETPMMETPSHESSLPLSALSCLLSPRSCRTALLPRSPQITQGRSAERGLRERRDQRPMAAEAQRHHRKVATVSERLHVAVVVALASASERFRAFLSSFG